MHSRRHRKCGKEHASEWRARRQVQKNPSIVESNAAESSATDKAAAVKGTVTMADVAANKAAHAAASMAKPVVS